MSNDFYIAFLTGWFVLIIFWSIIIIFVYIRKPPNAKLTKKVFLVSYGIFLMMLILILLFNHADSFFYFFKFCKSTICSG